jgi:hypothetical protein
MSFFNGMSGDTEPVASTEENQIEAQRSGFDLKRKSNGVSAL